MAFASVDKSALVYGASVNGHGSYPTTYIVNYDPPAKEFRITLGGLTKH